MQYMDTSALIALSDHGDKNHDAAKSHFVHSVEKGARFVLGKPVVIEYIDGVAKKIGKAKAIAELEIILTSTLRLLEMDAEEDFEKGIYYFKKYRDKIDLTDCISFAMIERLKLDKVFTFDRDFAIHGFKVVP